MTTSTFGEHLKREREMRGVSLDEISVATRIGTRFLEALENEQWDRLPGGVFNRGFVRAISRFLGLDEEGLLAEYALAVNDRVEAPAWTGAGFPPRARTNWITWLLAAVLLILVVGGAWAAWRRHVAKRAHVQAPAAQVAQTPAAPQGAAIPPPARSEANAPASAPPADANATPNPAEPALLELKLEAGKSTTVSVVADGKSVFDGKINSGVTRQFQATEKFDVSARDSSALLLELNGQVLPPLGRPGRPGKATITRKDLKKSSGGPD
jgi:cytoskeleton protein RodZ